MPRSVLNDLRRRAVDALLERPGHPVSTGDPLAELRSVARSPGVRKEPLAPGLTVLVRSLAHLDAVLSWQPANGLPRPTAVYCDLEDLRLYKEAVPRARAAGIPVGLAALRIVKPGEEGFHAPIVRAEPDRVVIEITHDDELG